MPAIVDHDARRLEISAAVGRIVSREGIQAVTIRSTAKEAGYSTAVITHYFHNKEDLMTFTYMSARDRTASRIERAVLSGKGLFDCLRECLPTNASQRTDWLLWFGLWGVSINNAALMDERRRGVEESNNLFQRVIKSAVNLGEITTPDDLEMAATRLTVMVNGIASLAVQLPDRWPPKSIDKLLVTELASFGWVK